MPKKNIFTWAEGAELEDHSKKKHEILRNYLLKYLSIRCQIRNAEKFRFAFIDGLCGGGRYKCGSPGSPLIVLESLLETASSLNLIRQSENTKPIVLEAHLYFNDIDAEAIEKLKNEIAHLASTCSQHEYLDTHINFSSCAFNDFYPLVKDSLISNKLRSVFFNLDQGGNSLVDFSILKDIMCSWPNPEILFTFMIETITSYLSTEQSKSTVRLPGECEVEVYELLKNSSELINKKEWLGKTERIVYELLRSYCQYLSPFSINNSDGWRYWLLHFANNYRARQAYNDTLHSENVTQAHFGRSGLKMLSYESSSEGQLYLFDENSRQQSLKELENDIPELISGSGDAMTVDEFFFQIYSETPAHSDDIQTALINAPDIEIITTNGGSRRKSNTIHTTDTIKLSPQKSFFELFNNPLDENE